MQGRMWERDIQDDKKKGTYANFYCLRKDRKHRLQNETTYAFIHNLDPHKVILQRFVC